jgi:hypothetical protein
MGGRQQWGNSGCRYGPQGTENFLISGTNKLGGDAFWFGREDAHDSRGFFPQRCRLKN